MDFYIGQQIKDENFSGTIVGFYHPHFYLDYFIKDEKLKKNFDKAWERFENWKDKLLVIIAYDKPVRNMTRQEVADKINIPVDMINDMLYSMLTIETDTMVVPVDAIKIS